MLYFLFFLLALFYNFWKFHNERDAFLHSLIEANNSKHQEMILGHHFYVFIFESFLGFIVAHLMTEGSLEIGMLGLGIAYLILLFFGFLIYQIFVSYLQKITGLEFEFSFRKNLIQEIRINLALVFLPILLYSIINQTFHDEIFSEWGDFWFIGLISNILFVSVLTIICSVIIMLKLIPNREITEEAYLKLISQRLHQIGKPNLRVRWIEADVKNAFVVGLKIFRFTNQTMFLGKKLRTMLTLEEFDAVVCHELSHVANGHVSKRLVDLLKNFLSILMGSVLLILTVLFLGYFFWDEELVLHTNLLVFTSITLSMLWFIFNYGLFFDSIRSHEFEADGFAVIKLGVRFEFWRSALLKLSSEEDIPAYLKKKNPQKTSRLLNQIRSYFSTHPSFEERVKFLHKKMNKDLPYNYYVSSFQKIRNSLSFLFQWKVLVSSLVLFFVTFIWLIFTLQRGSKLISWIQQANSEEIILREDLNLKYNSSPTLIGPSLAYYIVKKGDSKLLDHLITNNVPPGKIMLYLAEFKDEQKFQKYFHRFSSDLEHEEYFLILRKTAQVNFLSGYRTLINSRQFESLDSSMRRDVSRLIERSRAPASKN